MFTKKIKILKLFGIPIYLDLSWFLIVLLITWSLASNVFPQFYEELSTSTYWLMGLAGALGLFVSILAHELGHSLVAREFNVPMRGITLFIFGGVAEMTEEPPSAKAEFFVAIAGPVVSVAIAVGCYLLAMFGSALLPTPIVGVLWYLGVINAVLVGFNLIPAFPLDGGRVLRSILWYVRGSLRWATKITSTIGAGFGMFLILLGILGFIQGNIIGGMWQVLIGIFLRNAAMMSYQQVLIRRALEGESIDRFMNSDPISVSPSISIGQLVEDYIYRYHHKMFPVTDDGKLLGCITTREVHQVPREQWGTRAVGDVLRPCDEENTIERGSDAMQALSRIGQGQQSRLMVVQNGQLQGILSLKDLLQFISLKVELEDDLPPQIPQSSQEHRNLS